jgi:hypothetical protein
MVENPLHNKEHIAAIKAASLKDADKFGVKSRFGYFSIPYPISIGDKHYTTRGKLPEKNDNGKIVTLPRNPQTTVLKSGKGPDVYFQNSVLEEKKFIQDREAFFKKQQKEYLNSIQIKKQEKNFKKTFMPGGPQERKDWLLTQPFIPKNTIYKDIPRHTYYDKQTKKIICENRNIQTNPTRLATVSENPTNIFSYPKQDYKKLKQLRPNTCLKHKKDKDEGGDFHGAFKPASTALNGHFFSDKKQYGLQKNVYDKFSDDYKRAKTAGGRKFVEGSKDYYTFHQRRFYPASGKKQGETGYFSQRYGVPFVPYIAKKKINEEKDGKFNQTFKPNLLMDASKFSSTVMLNRNNLKNEFPKISGIFQ